jgi:hypothetical protein
LRPWEQEAPETVCGAEKGEVCVRQLSVTVTTNTQDSQFIKRKGLFWKTVLEVLVHVQVNSLLLGLRQGHHWQWQGACGRASCNSWLRKKEKKRKGLESPTSLQSHAPNDLKTSR